jgi:hypothetical protein
VRRTRILTAVLALAAGLLAGSPSALAASTPTTALAADTYTWKNARIDGGGFVPGIVFNRSEKNLAYARTDIGGAYRWQESTKTWTPLTDSVGWDQWGHTGVVSLASDSVDPNKVYAAVGTYTNSWDPGNGAVLRSADRGASWQRTDLPFKLGGNMPGRGMGERLAIDPGKDSVLYLGAPSGKGLWRSTDSGVTWSQVTNFPNAGNYVQDASDTSGYASDNQGIVWVTFDESTGTSGNATQTIYVGVADKDNAVYRSTDGGATWSRLPGQPTGYLAHKGVLDATDGYLYVAYGDKGGPYDGGKGQLWRYATRTGTWCCAGAARWLPPERTDCFCSPSRRRVRRSCRLQASVCKGSLRIQTGQCRHRVRDAVPQSGGLQHLDRRAQSKEFVVGLVEGLDGYGGTRPTVLIRVTVDLDGSRRRTGESGSRGHPDHCLGTVQAVVELPLVRSPVRGQVERLRAAELVTGGAEFEDLVDAVRTRSGARDDVPAACLQNQAVRLQAAPHIRWLAPAAVQDVQPPRVPDGVGDGGEVRGVVGVRVPAGGVQVEAAADPVGVLAQLAREGGTHLQLSGGQDRAEAQLGGGAGDAGEEEGLGLPLREAGETGAVAVEEAVAAGVPGIAVQRDARRAQRLHVPVDRAHRDVELLGEVGGGHPAAGLEQQEDRDEPAGLH